MPRTSDTSSRKAPQTGFLDPFAQFGVRPDRLIAGIDEVGRGALAGPVTAAAVILPRDVEIQGLADSKTLTPSKRMTVAAAVQQVAIAVSVAHVEPAVIDAVGIAEATRRAMLGALAGLSVDPHLALIDGLPVELGIEAYALVKGDSLLASVAAASVVAKVARDGLMAELDQAHPGYGFAVHKGYGTAEHLAALERLGPSPVHRMSFAPCSQRRLF
jgi:ribonuclease HII